MIDICPDSAFHIALFVLSVCSYAHSDFARLHAPHILCCITTTAQCIISAALVNSLLRLDQLLSNLHVSRVPVGNSKRAHPVRRRKWTHAPHTRGADLVNSLRRSGQHLGSRHVSRVLVGNSKRAHPVLRRKWIHAPHTRSAVLANSPQRLGQQLSSRHANRALVVDSKQAYPVHRFK